MENATFLYILRRWIRYLDLLLNFERLMLDVMHFRL